MRKSIALLVASIVFGLVALPARATLLYATSGNDIARFDRGATGVVTSVPVTGMQAGESLVGIDTRPATQTLYGVGSSNRLYTINPLTGAATQVGTAGAFTLSGTQFAVDFNPVVDRLRVISNTGQNLRLNPNDGSLAATDTAITPAGVTITGAAYDRNAPGSARATAKWPATPTAAPSDRHWCRPAARAAGCPRPGRHAARSRGTPASC